ncbi:MAG: hypothetical protein ACREVE_16930 [Gammaproteobacteria bacterium]
MSPRQGIEPPLTGHHAQDSERHRHGDFEHLTRLADRLQAPLPRSAKSHPGEPLDKNLYELPLKSVPKTPASLEEALGALEGDHEFLLQGGVFTGDVIDTWLSYKRGRECDGVRLLPHPYEFTLYFDA